MRHWEEGGLSQRSSDFKMGEEKAKWRRGSEIVLSRRADQLAKTKDFYPKGSIINVDSQ